MGRTTWALPEPDGTIFVLWSISRRVYFERRKVNSMVPSFRLRPPSLDESSRYAASPLQALRATAALYARLALSPRAALRNLAYMQSDWADAALRRQLVAEAEAQGELRAGMVGQGSTDFSVRYGLMRTAFGSSR